VRTLAEIQSRFRNVVIRGGAEDLALLKPLLSGGKKPETRLRIHQRNYSTSLLDALLTKFPATAWLVGTSFLTEAARQFVVEYPPQAPCIAEYGLGFPEFLSRLPGVERTPYISDFARLEWYLGKVAIAVDEEPVGRQEFSAIDPDDLPDMRLTLQSGLFYLDASWPVDELMKFHLSEAVPDRFEITPDGVRMEVRGARGEFYFNRLEDAPYAFRKSVRNGCSIGDAAECALGINARFDPGEALASLIAEGLVTAVQQSTDERAGWRHYEDL
jgi:hypothetical protein